MVIDAPLIKWDAAQWLRHLERRSLNPIQLGLDRVLKVASRLNLLVPACKVITVAGTNGKGSTVNALETIYHQAGYKVGSYTSPHLIEFNERIKVDLTPISDLELCEAFVTIESARGEVDLTYFEVATLAALVHFKKMSLDIIILEVGLGGRLDATNIIDSDVAIITTIDFDHQDYLGTTLEAIGYEKAGILRREKPFIYADLNPPQSILKVAAERSSPVYLYEEAFFFTDHGSDWVFNGCGQALKGLTKPKIQLKSASAALTACFLLQEDLPISLECMYLAMSRIFVPGRLQLTHLEQQNVDVLYDVSHNPQSAQLLADTIKSYRHVKKVHAVFGALLDKDIMGLITPLKDCIDYWYPAQCDNKRAAPADYLLTRCKKAEILVEICYNSPLIAYEAALSHVESGDLIVVFGSFNTVSPIISAQHKLLEEKGIL
jgi:dihydrofolate synthase/folylpolyglutamate synthase